MQLPMTMLRLDIPDDLKTRLASRAAESGFANVEDYAKALLRADAEPDVIPPDVQQLLTDRLRDPRPGVEFTPEFRDEFRRRVDQRRGTGT